jgi:hypothetical protein
MTVTGIEWRDPHEEQCPSKHRPRRPAEAKDPGDDVVEIHDEAPEEAADGLDGFAEMT